jgi:hypothetical protein
MNHSTVVIKPHESLQQSADSHAVMDALKNTYTRFRAIPKERQQEKWLNIAVK